MGSSLSSRIEEALGSARYAPAELARATGLTSGYISKLRKGAKTQLSLEAAEKIALALNVDRDWLVTGVSPSQHLLTGGSGEYRTKRALGSSTAGRRIKVVSWAQAGQATDYAEIPFDWQLEMATDCPDADALGVQLRGDSMLPVYQENDVVTMMPSREPRTGCLVIAKLRDEGVMFKLYTEPSLGIIRLSSYNPAYPPFERLRDDFQWICPVFETRRNVW